MKKYSVPSRIEEDLEPEEVLFYNPNYEAKLSKSLSGNSLFIVSIIILGVLGLFVARLFQLQIIKGNYFKALALENQYRQYSLNAPRGLIFDTAGKVLAGNEVVYDIIFFPSQVNFGIKDRKSYEEVFLKVLGLTDSKASLVLESKSENPILLFETNDQKLKETIIGFDLPGLIAVENTRRKYPSGQVSSHILGYVNEVSKEELLKDSLYGFGELRGRDGLEEHYDKILRGQSGEVRFSRDDVSKVVTNPPQEGNFLVTSIDLDLQRVLWNELNSALAQLGLKKAAAVIQDPRTGSVLAMASFPSYDNNDFIAGSNPDFFKDIFQNKDRPLFNRVISGRLSPGSTIKLLVALAALEEKIIDPKKKILANGGITVKNQYDPSITYTFRDWKVHGLVDMIKAIANSVDVYFYTIGGGYYDISGLGIGKIVQYLKLALADKKLGIDLPGEIESFIPTPDWKQAKKGEGWYTGDTYNISIGQGDLLVTPLWLNSMTVAMANGGDLFQPHIVKKVVTSDGEVIETKEPKLLGKLDVNKNNLDIIKEGMRAAVTEGTVWRLKDFPIPIAGKTGSAEVVKGQSTNAWLTVFAPYENPEIAVTILIERGGHGENFPAQVVKKVLNWYFYKQ
ncbi:MAG: penicillin-binding protein 2 [Parcubacteria group bacterium]|nr:penicillin-binding protein 2 [Parcubacteria group bacterium]